MSSKTASTSLGASPREGSSRQSSRGAVMMVRAMASCWASPPESSPASWFSRSLSTGNSSNMASRSLLAAALSLRVAAPRRRLSETVSCLNSRRPSGTRPTPSLTMVSGSEAGDVLAHEVDLALGGPDQAHDGPQDGGLAGAVRARGRRRSRPRRRVMETSRTASMGPYRVVRCSTASIGVQRQVRPMPDPSADDLCVVRSALTEAH